MIKSTLLVFDYSVSLAHRLLQILLLLLLLLLLLHFLLLFLYVRACAVCMCVCVYVCLYSCVHMSLLVCMCVWLWLFVSVCLCSCVFVRMYLYASVFNCFCVLLNLTVCERVCTSSLLLTCNPLYTIPPPNPTPFWFSDLFANIPHLPRSVTINSGMTRRVMQSGVRTAFPIMKPHLGLLIMCPNPTVFSFSFVFSDVLPVLKLIVMLKWTPELFGECRIDTLALRSNCCVSSYILLNACLYLLIRFVTTHAGCDG